MLPQWDKYSEDELRTIVKLYYSDLGYHVDDLHESDRRGEKGADLVVNKLGEAEKIAIALKVKPVKMDIHQLQELANRGERQKKYIYTQTPATDFYFEMETYKSRVDFWDSRKLTYEISSSSPSLSVWLTASSHPLYSCVGQLNLSLALLLKKWRQKEKFQGKIEPDSNFYREIWRLKDDFSSLNKSLALLQDIFETTPPQSESLSTDTLYLSHLFVRALDTIMTDPLKEANSRLSALINEYGKFVSHIVERTSDRSNWLSYLNFDWSLTPGKVRSNLLSEVKEEERLKDEIDAFKKDLTIIERLSMEVDDKQFQSYFFEISNVARRLQSSAYFIECFIDDLFAYGIQKSFSEDAD